MTFFLTKASMVNLKKKWNHIFETSINLEIESGLGEKLLILNENLIPKDKHILEWQLRLIISFNKTLKFSLVMKGVF